MGRNEREGRVLRRDWSRLDNEGAKVPPVSAHLATERRGHRARRWRIMRQLRSTALGCGLRSVAYCSTRTLEAGATITRTGEGCSWAGLQRCKSPHACPRCALDLAQRNAAMMTKIETAARHRGLSIDLVTLTQPHTREDSLSDSLDWLLNCWSRLWRSGSFRDRMERLGFVGAIRAFEATYTSNGWHVHLHVALVRRAGPAADSSNALVQRWLTMDARRSPKAQDVQFNVGAVSDYVGKGSMRLGQELAAGAATKLAKGDGASPLQLAEAAASGDRRALALWREWITATKGRRAWHIIGRGDLQTELSTDVFEATEPEDSVLQPVATFTPAQFYVIRRHRAEAVVLSIFEDNPDCRMQELNPDGLDDFLSWYAEQAAHVPPFL